jgi:hypothetical protein
MGDDTMPDPRSSYDLRRHLDTDHQLPLRGLAWTEMVRIHEHDHGADPGHTHEQAKGD